MTNRLTYGLLEQLIARMSPEQKKMHLTVELRDYEGSVECYPAELRIAGNNHDLLDEGHPVIYFAESQDGEVDEPRELDLEQSLQMVGISADVLVPPALLPGYETNFNTMRDACDNGQLALISAVRKHDGKPIALVAAMNFIDGSYHPVPLAVMCEGNPYEDFYDPTLVI